MTEQEPRGERSIRLVLVEDSEPDAELVIAELAHGGIDASVTRVPSPARFREALGVGSYDLILSDYNVPGFDGGAALREVQRVCPETPFIFVTGALGEERAIELLKLGATDVVLKDRLERLVPCVRRALREAHEIAERKRAEQALRESERALKTLIGNMPGMAFRCVPREPWVFEYASPGAYELTGYAPEEFYLGGRTTWASLMHPDDIEGVAAEAERTFAERRQLTVTYRIQTRSGDWKWVWDRSMGIYGESGGLEYIEGFVTDITVQKEAEAEAQQRAEFEQHLIGIVSHDLRTPLHAILLAASTAMRREPLDERTLKALLRIQTSGERAVRMIKDLLDFTQARLGGGIPIERRRTLLNRLVEHVIEEAELTTPDRQIRVEYGGEGEGEWDPDRLAQVVSNLLGNALRYSPQDSVVTVRTIESPDAVTLEVHNFGEPIAVELRGRLFQPMQRGVQRADRSTRSVGLGLYIVDQIVRTHGGEVEVESSKEEGTTFRIRLPTMSRTRPLEAE